MAVDESLAVPIPEPPSSTIVPSSARLRKVFVENYPGVWRLLRRLGTPPEQLDDAAQHVFLVAIEALSRIALGSERAFVYGTAVRVAHGIRRRAKREIPGLDAEVDRSPIPSADELTDQKRAREVLDALLDRMDLDLRTVFVLFEFDGFTTPEIADIIGVPLGTASSRLRRAREQFQELAQRAESLHQPRRSP